MIEQQRLAYLQALDIPVWVPRNQVGPSDPGVQPQCIRLGPGSGSTLMICAQPEQSSTALASDVARVLPDSPVWAWPDAEAGGPGLAKAVNESLFTTLVVFGYELAERLLGGEVPERLGPARVVVVDDVDILCASAGARRELWNKLCAGGVVSAQ